MGASLTSFGTQRQPTDNRHLAVLWPFELCSVPPRASSRRGATKWHWPQPPPIHPNLIYFENFHDSRRASSIRIRKCQRRCRENLWLLHKEDPCTSQGVTNLYNAQFDIWIGLAGRYNHPAKTGQSMSVCVCEVSVLPVDSCFS